MHCTKTALAVMTRAVLASCDAVQYATAQKGVIQKVGQVFVAI